MKHGILLFHARLLLTALSFFILFSLLPENLAAGTQTKDIHPFEGLKQRLVTDGFSKDYIDKLYGSPDVTLDIKGLSSYFVHAESTLNYHQFLSDKSIGAAMAYMAEHQKELDHAQEIYGVDKTIITAILLVETRLGTYTGKRSVLNTFSTLASLSESKTREAVWESIPPTKKLTRKKFEKKSDQKSDWAYRELKAFLTYTQQEGIDPLSINGSYAGAMGLCQFLPSNALTLARDGNQDGAIDLFLHPDAIHSIANFLKHHGWEPGITRQKAHKILFKYNHSTYYVDTLLKISDRLKG